MAILNSSIVFRTNHPDKGIGNNREFRLALIEELVAHLLLTNSSDGTFTGGRRLHLCHLLLTNSDGTFTGGRRLHLDLDRLKGKHFI